MKLARMALLVLAAAAEATDQAAAEVAVDRFALADLGQTTATLVIGASVDGRCFVRNERQELVVELYKPLGRTVALELEPGAYEVHVERAAATLVVKTQLAEGARVVLDSAQFTPTTKEATPRPGGSAAPPFAVAGRNRLDLRFGMFDITDGGRSSPVVITDESAVNVLGGLRYSRFLSEELVMTFGVDALAATSGTTVSSLGVSAGDTAVVAVPLGVRWNPAPGWTRSVKPYLDFSIGPVIGATSGAWVSTRRLYGGDVVEVTFGGLAGGGVDFHVSRGFSLGVSAGYRWMADFSRPIGARDNYSGFELALNIGWLFGAGSAPPE